MSDAAAKNTQRKPGRPSLPADQQVVSRGITLRAHEWAALDAEAKALRITRAQLIRDMLAPVFAKHNAL